MEFLPDQSSLQSSIATQHATEIVEASAWLEDEDLLSVDAKKQRLIKLLGPTDGQTKGAKKFVEEVKSDFPELVMKCYITDCEPGTLTRLQVASYSALSLKVNARHDGPPR